MADYETPDPTPHHAAMRISKRQSLSDQIREMVRSERLAQAALTAGHETFEEADDFEVGDDWEPSSQYEEVFEPEAVPANDGLDRQLANALRRVLRIEDDSETTPQKTDDKSTKKDSQALSDKTPHQPEG